MKPSRLFLPLSWFYGAVVAARNLLYDHRLIRIRKISVPVISVGNISAGGTGKTPFVVELVSILKDLGMKPAVVSRGYGRKSKGFQVVSNGRQKCAEAITAGDEPALLAEKLTAVPIVVDEKKARGSQMVAELFAPDVVVLDDGFQHRALFRDCDIVLMTANELEGRSFLLPAGYRREPFHSLGRANILVISNCRDVKQFEAAAAQLRERFQLPVIGLRTTAENIRRFGSEKKVDRHTLKGKNAVAFSGIADASSFDRTLAELGLNIVAHHRFGDHHWYTGADGEKIKQSFQDDEAEILVTTEKDMMRLGAGPEFFSSAPLFTIGIRSEIFAGEEELVQILKSMVKRKGK